MGHAAGRTGRLRALSVTHSEIKRGGSVAASIKRHGHHESLESLELVRCFPVELRVISGFRMLTALEPRDFDSDNDI
ncbi:unnamed protein product [Linum trigynum]|uniref:Uncharacterized protein n=1 Tax=Linum trigynum TaxID=586398 RepID=A0AAV2C9U0_9ROSI